MDHKHVYKCCMNIFSSVSSEKHGDVL